MPSVVEELFARHALFKTDALQYDDDEPQGEPERVVVRDQEGAVVREEYAMETRYYSGPPNRERLRTVEFYVNDEKGRKYLAMIRNFNRDGSRGDTRYFRPPARQ